MPSSNKENTLAADVPQHSYNMRKRVRTDHVDTGVSKDGCFVETAKRAIKRGCTELGIKKYASLSSMNEAHAQPLTTKHHTYSGRRLTRVHRRSAYSSADLSSEATVIVLPSEEDSLQEEEEEEEEEVAVKAGARGVCRLESQMTMVEGSSSPLRIFEQLDIPETQETVSEKKLIELSRLSDKELADTYAPLCEWMLEIEAKHASKLTFGMERHPDLSSRMRPILIDWLMEVAADYCMHRQTLHLTVQYLDRFLAHTTLRVRPSQLQCFGTACLSLAIKSEEQRVPTLSELTDFSKDAFTRDQLRAAEIDVLTALNWHLAVPTLHEFLALFFQRAALVCPDTFAINEDSTTNAGSGVLNWKFECPATVPRRFDDTLFLAACDYADTILQCQESLAFKASELAAACFYVGSDTSLLSSEVFAMCTGMPFSAVWPAVRYIKRLRAAVSPAGVAALTMREPCCSPKSRHGSRLKHIKKDELWAFQPHHTHLLNEFEDCFASRAW